MTLLKVQCTLVAEHREINLDLTWNPDSPCYFPVLEGPCSPMGRETHPLMTYPMLDQHAIGHARQDGPSGDIVASLLGRVTNYFYIALGACYIKENSCLILLSRSKGHGHRD